MFSSTAYVLLALASSALAAGPAAVNFGTAANYVILCETGASTVPNSYVVGNIGLSPAAATYYTGWTQTLDSSGTFSTSTQVTGNLYAADYADPTPAQLTAAIADMDSAYTDASTRASPDYTDLNGGSIGGLTFIPGLYKWTSNVAILSDITINGTCTDRWIFQVAGTLTMGSSVNVLLTGGAKASNIVWVVADAVAFGAMSHFEGNLLGMTSATLQTTSSMNGRILVQAAVALQQATVRTPF